MTVEEQAKLRRKRNKSNIAGRNSLRVEQIQIEDVSGVELKSVAQFKYLGTTVTTDGRSTKEIKNWRDSKRLCISQQNLGQHWDNTTLEEQTASTSDDDSTLQRRMLVVEETRYQNAGVFSFLIPKKTHEKEKMPRFWKHGY